MLIRNWIGILIRISIKTKSKLVIMSDNESESKSSSESECEFVIKFAIKNRINSEILSGSKSDA